jgi:hypothetical protein
MCGKQVVRSGDDTDHRPDAEEQSDPSGAEADLLFITSGGLDRVLAAID